MIAVAVMLEYRSTWLIVRSPLCTGDRLGHAIWRERGFFCRSIISMTAILSDAQTLVVDVY